MMRVLETLSNRCRFCRTPWIDYPWLGPVVASLLALALATSGAQAQYSRADGARIEARILEAPGCAPLAIISHGLGGSSAGNAPLAEALNKAGYRVVVPSHAESGPRLLMRSLGSGDRMAGIAKAASDPAAHRARMADLDAILAAEERRCPVPHKLLAGHSMGARTTLVEAGATNAAGVQGKNRFDLYIAVSAQGEGTDFFPRAAMATIRKPVLLITGTEDRSVDGGYETRLSTFESLPLGQKRMAVIDGADHMELGGKGNARVGRLVGEIAVEFARQIRPGPYQIAMRRAGVTVREK